MTSKKPNELVIVELSDVHLGHAKTKTTHILTVLRHIFADNADLDEVDLILFAGDLFDREISITSQERYEIEVWLNDFLRLCAKKNIIVRFLKGTPLHDWDQPKTVEHINEICEIGCNVKYIPEISIERIAELGIDVLYIPDEARPTCDETWYDVQKLLADKGLQQVDYVVMHGMFPHQMPKNVHSRLDMHNPDNYLSICRKYIFVGHVHTYSQYLRILASGSTDRTAHGEEGPKGHYRLRVRDNGEDEIRFIPNKAATRYVTVGCEGLNEVEVRDKLQSVMGKLPKGSHIRIRCRRDDIALALLNEYCNKYFHYEWSTPKLIGKDGDDTPLILQTRALPTMKSIDASNIVDLLTARVAKKNPEMVELCKQLLMETLDE